MRSAVLASLILLTVAGSAAAETNCRFEIAGSTMLLLEDCTTDVSIDIPDGMTLDGQGHAIVALDPAEGRFRGAVVVASGRSAAIVNTAISTLVLADTCQAGGARLRGIYFNGASGIIRGNIVIAINKGASACEEGQAIEARNGDAEGRTRVQIDHNTIDAYQKTGIVVTGAVDAWIHHNNIGASATQVTLAANAVQLGPGAGGVVEVNTIRGNSWPEGMAAGTGVLLAGSAPNTVVRGNVIIGNADVGIYVLADGATIEDNDLVDTGIDGAYDVGIGNYGTANRIVGNRVRGFTTPYQGVAERTPSGLTASLE